MARFHNYELTGLLFSKWDPDVSDYPPPVTLTQLRAAPCTKYDSQWRLGTGQEGGGDDTSRHYFSQSDDRARAGNDENHKYLQQRGDQERTEILCWL